MELFKKTKELAWDKVEEVNSILDNQAVMKYYETICKEDGVTFEEAIELCQTEPKYSMGLKMCSPAVIMMLRTKKGQEKFRTWLTPEELAIFDSPECPKNFREMIRKEKKKQKGKL